MPIEHYLDHGDSIEAGNTPQTTKLWEDYKAASAGKRTILKPGDKLPLKGLEAIVVSSNGEIIPKPINGGGPNSFCKDAKDHPLDATENQRSAGILLTYGKFKFLDLGDLTWDKEMELGCPVNRVGTVTLFQATHHGFVNDRSGAPPFIWALKPQVMVVNNGPRKGWQQSAWETAQKTQGVEDIWQIHLALATDKDHNVAEEKIANMEATAECQGHWIKASIARDGKYTVTNSRNNFSKTYAAR
jgi:hypothetical protein